MAFDTSFRDITGAAGDIIGSSQSGSGSGTTKTTSKSTTVQKLNIEQDAVDKIIQDVLGGADGLAAIFSGEQTSGIFDSSVAAQAAGDLASKLVGEIAKLTAEQETTTKQKTKEKRKEKSESGSGGLIGTIGGALGF